MSSNLPSGSMFGPVSKGGSSALPGETQSAPMPTSSENSHGSKLAWFRNDFRPHFDDWVFGPINRLVHTPDALVSFILMACAIDYLSSFWWGRSTKGEVELAYTSFVKEYFPKERYDAKGLYDSLRNGLVHMFTIKSAKYSLTHNRPNYHLQIDRSGQIVLNASDFRDDLIVAKNRYFDDVESKPDLLDKANERYLRDGFLELHPL